MISVPFEFSDFRAWMRVRGAIIRVPFLDHQLSRSTQLPSALLPSVDVCGDSCTNIVCPSPEMAEMADNPGTYAENYQSVSNAVYGGTTFVHFTRGQSPEIH